MTDVKIFIPENRLSHVLHKDGRSATALAQVSARAVSELADSLDFVVQDQVKAVAEIRDAGIDLLFAHSGKLREVAMAIAEIAGAARREDLGHAARGILAMLDAQDDGVWRPEALDLHLAAIAVLGGSEAVSSQEADAMLDRLAEMRAYVGVTE